MNRQRTSFSCYSRGPFVGNYLSQLAGINRDHCLGPFLRENDSGVLGPIRFLATKTLGFPADELSGPLVLPLPSWLLPDYLDFSSNTWTILRLRYIFAVHSFPFNQSFPIFLSDAHCDDRRHRCHRGLVVLLGGLSVGHGRLVDIQLLVDPW